MAKNLPASIMPKEFAGVFFGTGNRGVGKSTCFAQAERPELTCFIDFDDGKGRALHEQLGFSRYDDVKADLASAYGRVYNMLQTYEYIDKLIDGIENDLYTHCILDNIDDVEKSITVEVKKNPDAYGIGRNPKTGVSHAASGAFGGPYPAVNDLISGLVSSLHSKGIRVVTAIAHTKDYWGAAGPVPGKRKVRGVERWQQMSILSLVVIPGTPDPIPPAALVQKEALGKLSFDKSTGKFDKPIRRLPLRLPEANFDEIKKYLKKPADLRSPKPGEVPTMDEQSPFSDKFSKEQLAYMTLAAQVELAKDRENGNSLLSPISDNAMEQAKAMFADGKSPKEVSESLGIKKSDLVNAGLLD